MVYVRRLIWDPGNVAHIARHEVTVEEVEEVCQGAHIQGQAYAGRIMVIGTTGAGRMLSVVMEPYPAEAGVYYLVTARPASRKERRVFLGEKGA